MLQAKIIARIVGIWVVVGLCLMAWYQFHSTLEPTKKVMPDSEQELVASLTYIPNTEKFELRLENRAQYDLAVVRHPHLYEVRAFDCSGQKVTNLDVYMERICSDGVANEDWVILRPQEAISFPVWAYRLPERNGKIDVSGLQADCVRYEHMSYNSVPDFVKKANAKIAVFNGTPSISL